MQCEKVDCRIDGVYLLYILCFYTPKTGDNMCACITLVLKDNCDNVNAKLQAKLQWLQKEVNEVISLEVKLKRKLKELKLKVCSVNT